MADAIYDFKRVDPDWQDTLGVTTIPTQSGAYGNDGDLVFSVRQSRLGIKGDDGYDITYILEGLNTCTRRAITLISSRPAANYLPCSLTGSVL